jgi:hypothetical protein
MKDQKKSSNDEKIKNNNIISKKKMKISKHLECIIKDKATEKNINANMNTMDLTNIIIKDIKMDQKYHLMTIGRRLLYCCPNIEGI